MGEAGEEFGVVGDQGERARIEFGGQTEVAVLERDARVVGEGGDEAGV